MRRFVWAFCFVTVGCEGGGPSALQGNPRGTVVPTQSELPAGNGANQTASAAATSGDDSLQEDAGSDDRASAGHGAHEPLSGSAAGAAGAVWATSDAGALPSDDDDEDEEEDDEEHDEDD
jgi:hypothetical protein